MFRSFVRKLSIFAFVSLYAFANENPYQGITELSYTKYRVLWAEYIEKNNLKGPYGFYNDKTSDLVDFLEQFVDLERLSLGVLSSMVEVDEFTQKPPVLPHLKSLTLMDKFSAYDLDWLISFPFLEELMVFDFHDIDVAPLGALKHLRKLDLFWGDDAEVIHADQLPTTLKELYLDECHLDPNDLNHLRLKELSLNSNLITHLPGKESLVGLEFLDISGSSISDLSPLEGNQSLKIFDYSYPSREGVRANFNVIHTLTNLEQLILIDFPRNHIVLDQCIRGLPKLQDLVLSGEKIHDLSFLEGMNLSHLSIPGSLINCVPSSVLSNPQLIEFDTRGLEFPDGVFSWNDFSPNIRKLDLGRSDYCDISELKRFPLVDFKCDRVDVIENGKELIAFAPTLESLTTKGDLIFSLIDEYGDDVFSSFVKLKTLNLDLARDDRIGSLEYLKKFPALEGLEIEMSRAMDSETLDVFLEMKQLKSVHLMNLTFEAWKRSEELAKLGVPIL